ncbi:MAG TPA: UbiA-like polyprenyltransferase [Bacteroidales bacterium]|nr:UbiA-like polyprenyltransferase [Bacteroidales bacterium]
MARTSIQHFLSLVKFAHSVFSLPFALVAFFMALADTGHAFSFRLLVLVVAAVVLARNTAMAFNRWTDRYIDALNPRTRLREIPARIVSPPAALAFTLLNAAGFIGVAWLINPLCFWLSPLALAVIMGYSYAKRFTSWSHLLLGLGLGLAPSGAYIAVSGEISLIPVLLSVAVIFWVAGFDIIYALQDEGFDKDHGLFSLPSRLGARRALLVSVGMHAVTGALLLLIGTLGSFNWIYWGGALTFIALLVYQHWIVKPDDLSRVNLAFFSTNGVASILFGLAAILDLLVF